MNIAAKFSHVGRALMARHGSHNQFTVGRSAQPTPADAGEHCVLRAALAAEGRGIVLYEEVHPKKKENNDKVHCTFLNNLKSVLPACCHPCIITDSGFKNPWFKAVSSLGWDFVGRLQSLVGYNEGTGFKSLNSLFTQATTKVYWNLPCG